MSEQETGAAGIYQLTIQIQPTDIDQLGHVNNVSYLRWVQDIAIAHWTAIAAKDDQKKLRWIVLRHEIDYRQPAFLGETLLARTWVGEARGLKFERHTEFLRSGEGRSVAKARTVWCPIDAITGRPTEVSAEVREYFSRP